MVKTKKACGNMETLQQFNTLQTVNDRRCYSHFEKILQTKQSITVGLTPDYITAINAIRYIESESDHLKYFVGFVKAKRLILEEYQNTNEE